MAKPKRAQRPTGVQRVAGGAANATKTKPAASDAGNGATKLNGNTSSTKLNGASGNGKSMYGKAASDQPSRLAGLRERVPAQRRRRYAVKPWWQGGWGVTLAAVSILLIVGIFAWLAYQANLASAVGIGSTVPSSIMTEVTGVPSSVFSTVGAGPNPLQMQALPASTPSLTANSRSPIFYVGGHPEILFVGGEYCPYCAAERWGLVIALSRFGTFRNLHLMKSSHTDVYADTNTFTFYRSSYTSKYIVFTPVEVYDRNQQTLQTLTSAQQQVFTTYDSSSYTQSPGSIPFTDYGGLYVAIGAPFVPTSLQGLTWQQIAAGLNDPTNAATQDIIGTANQITATVCMMDNQQPGSVCKLPAIQQIEKKLPRRK